MRAHVQAFVRTCMRVQSNLGGALQVTGPLKSAPDRVHIRALRCIFDECKASIVSFVHTSDTQAICRHVVLCVGRWEIDRFLLWWTHPFALDSLYSSLCSGGTLNAASPDTSVMNASFNAACPVCAGGVFHVTYRASLTLELCVLRNPSAHQVRNARARNSFR